LIGHHRDRAIVAGLRGREDLLHPAGLARPPHHTVMDGLLVGGLHHAKRRTRTAIGLQLGRALLRSRTGRDVGRRRRGLAIRTQHIARSAERIVAEHLPSNKQPTDDGRQTTQENLLSTHYSPTWTRWIGRKVSVVPPFIGSRV